MSAEAKAERGTEEGFGAATPARPRRIETFPFALPALIWAAFATLLCWAATRSFRPWVNQDVAFNLVSGTKIVDGGRLYVDWHDTNPPAIHVLSAGIAAVARFAHLPPVLTYHLSVLLGFAGAVGLLVRNAQALGTARTRVIVLSLLVILVTPSLLRFEDFGQREQLWLVVFFPIFLLRLHGVRDKVRHFQLASGLLGLASGFKPHLLLSVFLGEVILRRPGRKDALAFWLPFGAGLLAPFVVLLCLAPSSAQGFWRDASLSATTYARLGRWPLARVFTQGWTFTGLIATVAGLASASVLQRRNLLSTRAARAIAAVLVLNAAFVFVQGKFLPYHWIPSLGLGFLLSVWLAASVASPHTEPVLALGLLMALGLGFFNATAVLGAGSPTFPFRALLRREQKVMLFSTSVWAVRPLYLEGVQLSGPWLMHFALPMLVKRPRDERLATIRSEVETQLARERPELVMFEDPERWLLEKGDTISSLVSDAGITLPLSYSELGEHDLTACCGGRHGWRIYRRSD